MIIKRYIVKNMSEAMTRIRYELGKDAVIISQRKVKKPGFLGFFSPRVMEVTAAVDNAKKDKEDLKEESKEQTKSITESIQAIKKVMENPSCTEAQIKPVEKESKEIKDSMDSEVILKEMQEMKTMITDMVNKTEANTPAKGTRKTKLQKTLEDLDVSESIAKKINSRKSISEMIKVSEEELYGTVVLVGPTGVGKTTTIAKIAGKLALTEKKKVGLITIDTYRIGAVEQLKTYAEIMNIPFKVVLSIKDMEAAIQSFKDFDVILVDTTGRNSKNSMQISELRAFIEKTNPQSTHLVVSGTTKSRDMQLITEGYSILNFNNVIITKLDETTTYGSIINILSLADKPLSYITTGQNVPEDIKKPTIEELTRLILGEDSLC